MPNEEMLYPPHMKEHLCSLNKNAPANGENTEPVIRSLDQYLADILSFGESTEDAAEIAAFIKDQQERIDAVRTACAGKQPVRVFIYAGKNDAGHIFTSSSEHFETLLIEAAGGRSIFHDRTGGLWVTVSEQEIVSMDPQVMVIHAGEEDIFDEMTADIEQSPQLSQLRCVRESNFVPIAQENVMPGVQVANAVEWFFRWFQKADNQL